MREGPYQAVYVSKQNTVHVWNVKGPGIDRLVPNSSQSYGFMLATNLSSDLNIAYAAGAEQKK